MNRTYARSRYAVAQVAYGQIWQHGARSLREAKRMADSLTHGSFSRYKGMTWIENPYITPQRGHK